ncbi:hypothetical protein ENKNEFLB_04379 [Nocardioides aquaticus]|uniref:DUF2332 domain-containing protein n=1 Tax=Nocardioides aquaticus TaxID=160826 RepID=A0ABX8EN58_9ACTN|nr:DUF2332 domain-containing protein [Nocardioides aquaticus]QVT81960.1 hypothetical protein ENKNEFLB_04379 [Nocardioides aquaticus]
MEVFGDVADVWRDFGTYEAPDGCFHDWALRVADDPEVLAWLRTLASDRERQPNLILAAARWNGVAAPGPYDALRAALLGDDAEGRRRGTPTGPVRATVAGRRTQTNEVGRLATLAPVLGLLAARHGGPLALLEIGASAGLCLYPDRWDYTWHLPDGEVSTHDGAAGRLTCEVTGQAPGSEVWPAGPLPVAWRGGLDLAPVDVTDDDQVAWLETLVWPEHDDRRARLRTAVEVARADPPTVVAADLTTSEGLDLLDGLVEEAGRHGRVVVMHSAVTAYLPVAARQVLEQRLRGLVAAGRAHWLSNEGKRVHPAVTATGPPVPDDVATFVLGLDGRAAAWTHGHGRSMRWVAPAQL